MPPTFARRHGLTIVEILVVVAIIGVLSMAIVPVAELSFIRLKEAEFEENLKTIRGAIQQWRRESERALWRAGLSRAVISALPDCYLFPPDIGSLTKAIPYVIPGSGGVTFFPKPYLTAIPYDPFVGGAVWTQFYASGTATTTYRFGTIEPTANVGTGVFDISGHPEPSVRRGFTEAIDGTQYADW
jgi:general secretion pathway protein G